MQVTVESKNIEVTAALRQFAQKQAQKLTKVYRKISLTRFFLDHLKKRQNDPSANNVTVKIEVPGKDILVKEQAVDMYEAMRRAVATALRHLRKKLEKERTKNRVNNRAGKHLE